MTKTDGTPLRVGIIGAGHIAIKMANTLSQWPGSRYAIAARDSQRAAAFAAEYGFARSYGSYLELVEDPEVDLVYVATPHSHHFAHVRLALEHGKHVLCEKAFTANAREAETLIRLAEERGLLLAEAMWPRYMPFMQTVRETLDSGVIGEPRLLSGSLCYPILWKERIRKPELCGGALLDIGVYALTFARMLFGTDIAEMHSAATRSAEGMDMQESITLIYSDGRMANLQSSVLAAYSLEGVIGGTKGYMVVDNINCPRHLSVYAEDHTLVSECHSTQTGTGFEYEVEACAEAIRNGWTECPAFPHAEILAVMRQMDTLRQQWGVHFPMDEEGE